MSKGLAKYIIILANFSARLKFCNKVLRRRPNLHGGELRAEIVKRAFVVQDAAVHIDRDGEANLLANSKRDLRLATAQHFLIL